MSHQTTHPPTGWTSKEYRPLHLDQEPLGPDRKDMCPRNLITLVLLVEMVAFLLLVVTLVPLMMTMLKIRGVRLVLKQWVPLEEEVPHS